MKITARILSFLVLLLVLLLGLPLLGIVCVGKPVHHYFEFPPLTQYVQHAPFSGPVFISLSLIIGLVMVPFICRVISQQTRVQPGLRKMYGFPWWGWAGLTIGVTAWILAWTRFSWFMQFQVFIFTPLWMAYILVVNAATFFRTGHCMLKDRQRFFLLLFPVSAGFWWFFEYLNRFAQNWHYVGISELTPWQYFFFATLPFSTVLPAVLGTHDLLQSFPKLSCGLDHFMPIRVYTGKTTGWLILLIAGAGLAGVGVWPDLLFPLLWVSPLLILVSLQIIGGERTILSDISAGCWRNIYLLALSALVCGFFWEMWNFNSFAKWIYTIPYVNRFHVFEMPILGYSGYLSFGLECGVIAGILESSGTKGNG